MKTSWLHHELIFENQLVGIGIVSRKAQVCAKFHFPTLAVTLFSKDVDGGIHSSSVIESQNSPANTEGTIVQNYL